MLVVGVLNVEESCSSGVHSVDCRDYDAEAFQGQTDVGQPLSDTANR